MQQKRVNNISKEQIAEFCQRNQIMKFAFYGSVLRDDFKPESDVDILIDLEPNHSIGLMKMAHMENELSDLIGRKVDLRTPQDLSKYFRDKVVSEAETIFERN